MVSSCGTASYLCQWVEDQSTHLSTSISKWYTWHRHSNHRQRLIMAIPSGHKLNYPIHFNGSTYSNQIGIGTTFGHVCCGYDALTMELACIMVDYGTCMYHCRRLALKENLHVMLMSVVFLDDTHSFALHVTIAFKILNILGFWPTNSVMGLPTQSSFIIDKYSYCLCTRVDGV